MTEKVPTEYNQIVQLVRNNDVSVVANVIENHFTPNKDLERIIDEWREEAHNEAMRENRRASSKCYQHADQLEEVIGDE
jgi:hypothetical protein